MRSRRAARAVAKRRGDDQRALAADLHRHHALIPALDHLADADRERERLPAVDGAVELLAVRQLAGVVHRDLLALRGRVAAPDDLVGVLQSARRRHLVCHVRPRSFVLTCVYWMPNSSTSKISVAPPGMLGASLRSVRQCRRDDQPALAADLHPVDALRPTRDDVAQRRERGRLPRSTELSNFVPSVSQPV